MLGGRRREHPFCDLLRQEERPAQIDVHHAVVALGRDLQQVAALLHRDACIVDKAFEAAEGLEGALRDAGNGFEIGYIAQDELRVRPALTHARKSRGRRLVLDEIVDDDVVARFREAECDPAADAAARAGDENPRTRTHRAAPLA